MPMLAADTASTTAKPSMILARNRKVGSLSDIDCGRACFDNSTSNSCPASENRQNRQGKPPGPKQKRRGKWRRGCKTYRHQRKSARNTQLCTNEAILAGFAGLLAPHGHGKLSDRVMVQGAIVVVRRRFDRVQFEPGQFRRHGIFRDVESGWPKKKTLRLIL